jgi:hypothetical protein
MPLRLARWTPRPIRPSRPARTWSVVACDCILQTIMMILQEVRTEDLALTANLAMVAHVDPTVKLDDPVSLLNDVYL